MARNLYEMSDIFNKVSDLPTTRDMWKSVDPDLMTIQDFTKALYELSAMCENLDPNMKLLKQRTITNHMEELFTVIKKMGGHIAKPLDIDPEGIVRDGQGYVYAGTANRRYKIGQKLDKKTANEIVKYLNPVVYNNNYPIIMFSLVLNESCECEQYYYFTPVYEDASDSNNRRYKKFTYICNNIHSSQFGGNAFSNYIIHRLTNIVNIEKSWYYACINREDQLALMDELQSLPMGTIVVFNDTTIIKTASLGNWGGLRAFVGAVDI